MLDGTLIPEMSATPEAPEQVKPAAVPQELLGSTVFLLKRLGEAARERAVSGYVGAGCSPYHHAVLALLAEGARETQAAIAEALGVDRSQLVGILDELEEAGLVERRRDRNDRRRHVVTMTPEGKRSLTRFRTIIKEIDDEFLTPLSHTERAALHDLVLRLAGHHDPRFAAPGSRARAKE
jgi:MarR family transcriptional regulator, lower aerobic nicotinate degradation pathway regulator